MQGPSLEHHPLAGPLEGARGKGGVLIMSGKNPQTIRRQSEVGDKTFFSLVASVNMVESLRRMCHVGAWSK